MAKFNGSIDQGNVASGNCAWCSALQQ